MSKPFSIAARIKSFAYAFKGFGHFVRTQHNGWIHLFATAVVVAAGGYFGLAVWEWCAVIFAIAFVISAELINTAIEFVVDLVSPDYHELAGKAKDVAATAVLVAAIAAAIVGVLIFGPKVLALFEAS